MLCRHWTGLPCRASCLLLLLLLLLTSHHSLSQHRAMDTSHLSQLLTLYPILVFLLLQVVELKVEEEEAAEEKEVLVTSDGEWC